MSVIALHESLGSAGPYRTQIINAHMKRTGSIIQSQKVFTLRV